MQVTVRNEVTFGFGGTLDDDTDLVIAAGLDTYQLRDLVPRRARDRPDRSGRRDAAVRHRHGCMHLLGPVPGDGLVRPDLVVLEPVLLGVLGQHDGVVDLVDEQPFVLQGAEPAFA